MDQDPFAFATSPEDDVASAETVRNHLAGESDSVVLDAFDRELVGMLGLTREPRRKLAHKALVWGVFVREDFRRQGIAARLLDAAIAHARSMDGVTTLWLGVSERSPAALRLYAGAGFRAWGVEPDCIRFAGESVPLHYLDLTLK